MSVSSSFGRSSLRDIAAYVPDPQRYEIDLSDNTNLWGPPPSAVRAIADAPPELLSRYPEAYSDSLRTALASYVGAPVECLIVGCGSDDVLDATIRASAEPGQRLAFLDPSFVMVPAFARMNCVEVVRVPIVQNGPDVQRFVELDATITYLCSPNNPTGGLIERADIEAIVNGTTGVVIIDEAYAEYSGVSSVDLAVRSERVVVARTMSKAFGLAGLRLGYAIAAPSLIREIEKSRGPFKVTGPAERAALAAVTSDTDWVAARVAEAIDSRTRFVDELEAAGLEPLPSAANFVLVPVGGAPLVAAGLRARGIAVRAFSALPTIGDALRITVGPWPMMEKTARALREVIAECA